MRSIWMMVRRETISFEPQDRVKLDLEVGMRDGSRKSLYVGDVYYDFDTDRMCFKLYDSDGKLIPSANGPRELESNLTGEELYRVELRVKEYFHDSLYRARNVAMVSKFLDEMGVDMYVYPYGSGGGPEVCVARSGDDRLEHLPVQGVFRTSDGSRSELFAVIGDPSDGSDFNYPFNRLTDIGVSNVVSSLQRQLGEKHEVKEKRVEAGDRKTGLQRGLSV